MHALENSRCARARTRKASACEGHVTHWGTVATCNASVTYRSPRPSSPSPVPSLPVPWLPIPLPPPHSAPLLTVRDQPSASSPPVCLTACPLPAHVLPLPFCLPACPSTATSTPPALQPVCSPCGTSHQRPASGTCGSQRSHAGPAAAAGKGHKCVEKCARLDQRLMIALTMHFPYSETPCSRPPHTLPAPAPGWRAGGRGGTCRSTTAKP